MKRTVAIVWFFVVTALATLWIWTDEEPGCVTSCDPRNDI